MELAIGDYELALNWRRRARTQKPRPDGAQAWRANQEWRACERRKFQARRRNLNIPLFNAWGWM